MDAVFDLIGSLAWLASPAGVGVFIAVTVVVLSGLPGRLVLMFTGRMPR